MRVLHLKQQRVRQHHLSQRKGKHQLLSPFRVDQLLHRHQQLHPLKLQRRRLKKLQNQILPLIKDQRRNQQHRQPQCLNHLCRHSTEKPLSQPPQETAEEKEQREERERIAEAAANKSAAELVDQEQWEKIRLSEKEAKSKQAAASNTERAREAAEKARKEKADANSDEKPSRAITRLLVRCVAEFLQFWCSLFSCIQVLLHAKSKCSCIS